MKTSKQPMTTETLLDMLKEENNKYPHTYTDRKKTLLEILRMRGVSI